MKKLTPAMVAALKSIQAGRPWSHLQGKAEFGGAAWTRRTLIKRGLITGDDQLTDAGRAALAST